MHLLFSSLSLCKKWFISRLYKNNHPSGRFCVGNHRSKTYLKKFMGASPPLALPGSAYVMLIKYTLLKLNDWLFRLLINGKTDQPEKQHKNVCTRHITGIINTFADAGIHKIFQVCSDGFIATNHVYTLIANKIDLSELLLLCHRNKNQQLPLNWKVLFCWYFWETGFV